MYEYSAKVIRVVDGDTLIVLVDLGFKINIELRVRLSKINAPDISTIEGLTTKDMVESLVLNKKVVIKTTKDSKDKYGRYLAEVFIGNASINDYLVNNHYAILYK